jgi:hypothetical protein
MEVLTRPDEAELMFAQLLEDFDEGITDDYFTEAADADEQIMARALGAFDKASAYFSEDSTMLLRVASELGSRMQAMGCSHQHFLKTAGEQMGLEEDSLQRLLGIADHHDHTHNHPKASDAPQDQRAEPTSRYGSRSSQRKSRPNAAQAVSTPPATLFRKLGSLFTTSTTLFPTLKK